MSEPIVEKTTTEKASGEAALAQPPAPAPAADDKIRGHLAVVSTLVYGIFISLLIYLLVFHSDKISSVVATLIGTILGSQSSNISSVFQYYYGSSSGSTAKDKRP
jgi:ABC-type microcin C transport system permease subunit YejE